MNVLIADDELLARKRLRRLLAAMPEHELVAECQDGAEVLDALGQHPVDVVLLDIHMPGLTGVEAMQLWPVGGPPIVFTTAHAEHAVAAFDGGAADYLLKPVAADRLKKALDRVAERLADRRAAAASPALPPAAHGNRLALTTRTGVVLLSHDEIACCRIDGASVVVETDRGAFYTDLPLAELEERLGAGFRRLHRQALVHLDRVARFEDNGAGGYVAHVRIGDGERRVTVSRAVARDLRREWGL